MVVIAAVGAAVSSSPVARFILDKCSANVWKLDTFTPVPMNESVYDQFSGGYEGENFRISFMRKEGELVAQGDWRASGRGGKSGLVPDRIQFSMQTNGQRQSDFRETPGESSLGSFHMRPMPLLSERSNDID